MWRYALNQVGFSGSLPVAQSAMLKNLGYTDSSISNKWFKYWRDTPLQGVGLLALNDIFGGIGDSYIANGIGTSTNLIQWNDAGSVWTYANALGGGLLTTPPAARQGLAGDGVTAASARVAALNASGAVIDLVAAGINDIRNDIAASVIGPNLKTNIVDALTARFVIVCTLPTLYGGAALTGPQDAERVSLNTTIRSWASARILIADVDAVVTDSTFMDGTGLHLSHKGSLAVGRVIGAIIAAKSVATDAAAALVAAAFSTNAGMTGTGGSKTNATGNVANNYGLTGQAASFTTVASKAGNGEQIITTSGTYTGTAGSAFWSLSQDAGCSVVAGDVIELFCKFKILTNFDNLANIQIFNQLYSDDYGTIYAQQYMPIGSTQLYVDTDGYYVFRSLQLAAGIGAGGAHIDTFFQVYLKDGTGISATGAVQIAALGVRLVD
jgi:hypothetical protein